MTPTDYQSKILARVSQDGNWEWNSNINEWVTRYPMWHGKFLKTTEDWDAYRKGGTP